MKRQVKVTITVDVEVDETKFTREWMDEWKKTFYNFNSVEQHIEWIAWMEARGLLRPDFTEGYGPLKDMGIKAKTVREDQEIVGERHAA